MASYLARYLDKCEITDIDLGVLCYMLSNATKCDNNRTIVTNNYKGLQGQIQALQGQVSHFLSCFNCKCSPKGQRGKRF